MMTASTFSKMGLTWLASQMNGSCITPGFWPFSDDFYGFYLILLQLPHWVSIPVMLTSHVSAWLPFGRPDSLRGGNGPYQRWAEFHDCPMVYGGIRRKFTSRVKNAHFPIFSSETTVHRLRGGFVIFSWKRRPELSRILCQIGRYGTCGRWSTEVCSIVF